MKYIKTLFIVFIIQSSVYSQPEKSKYDSNVYLYKTFEDFQNDKSENIGYLYGSEWNSKLTVSLNKGLVALYVTSELDSKDSKRIAVDDFYGFKIDNFMFRVYKNKILSIVNNKSKIFYMDGFIILKMIYKNRETISLNYNATRDLVFYSDTYTSKVYGIKKILKNEKDAKYDELKKCIKKGKKRRDYNAKYNAYMECVTNF